MLVTLAYPYGAYPADATPDLPVDEARRLINDGRARLPSTGAKVTPSMVPQTVSQISAQLSRQESDRRAKLPLSTAATSIAASATLDAALTKTYAFCDPTALAAQTNATYRPMGAAEVAALPIDVGPPALQHLCFKNGTIGFHLLSPSKDPAVQPSPANAITPGEYRLRTASPKLAFGLWHYAGLGQTGYSLYIDGQPVALRPQLSGVAIDYLTLNFPDVQMRDIVLKTSAGVFGVYLPPIYDLVKPEPRVAPTLYSMWDSYGSIVWNDAGAATGALEESLPAGIEDWLGLGYHYIDAVGGTSFVTRAATGFQGPNNNYEDRLPQALRAAPDLFYASLTNDANAVAAGTITMQQVLDSMRRCFVQLRAVKPGMRLVVGEGYAPSYPGFAAANCVALRTAAQAALADLGVYYFGTSGELNGTGRADAPAGNGNQDWIVGHDAVHCTAKGYRALKLRQVPRWRRVLADDGTLLNQVL